MSLQGFVWEARPDRLVEGYDPLNSWLLRDGAQFFRREISKSASKARTQDFSITLETQPKSVRSAQQPSFAQFSPTPLNASGLDEDIPTFSFRRGLAGRKFVMPLDRRSIGASEDRITGGFEPIGWEPPSSIDPARTVIVGVIDHAINFAHPRFRSDATGSRVDFAWVQDGLGLENRPVPYGRAWTKDQIDAAVSGSYYDEEGIFDKLDLVDFAQQRDNPLSYRLSHGTHVMDVAAGAMASDLAAENTRLISVTLPSFVAQETSGGLLSLFFIQGLDFLLRQAFQMCKALGRSVPVLVNFSFSVSGGPRNGQHVIERSIQTLFDDYVADLEALGFDATRPEIYMPAGNRNLARSHTNVAPKPNGQLELGIPWRIQPEDLTPSYLEIWLPEAATDIALDVQAPGQLASRQTIHLNDETPHILWSDGDNNTVLARVSLDTIETRQRVFIAFAPTLVLAGERVPLPSGLWQIDLSATCLNGGTCEAWVLRDDTPPGFRKLGQQSYLDDPAYERFTNVGDVRDQDPELSQAVVKRTGTSNGMATGQQGPFIVSGFREHEIARGQGASSSAAYSATTGTQQPKHIGAISDTSRITGGVLAAGTHGGSTAAMNGTSVATPHAVRQRTIDLQNPSAISTAASPEDVFDHALIQVGPGPLQPRSVRGVLSKAYRDPTKPDR